MNFIRGYILHANIRNFRAFIYSRNSVVLGGSHCVADTRRAELINCALAKFVFQDAWNSEKKDGLEQLLKEKLPKVEEKKIDDLLFILKRHFDPEKKPKAKEVSESKGDARSRSQKVSDDKENNNKCDSGTESPDTTTSGSPVKLTAEDKTKTF